MHIIATRLKNKRQKTMLFYRSLSTSQSQSDDVPNPSYDVGLDYSYTLKEAKHIKLLQGARMGVDDGHLPPTSPFIKKLWALSEGFILQKRGRTPVACDNPQNSAVICAQLLCLGIHRIQMKTMTFGYAVVSAG